jgi:putative ABC transport system permease protein
MEMMWREFRYALRSVRKVPAFSAAAIVTLALGIGANTAIFSVVERVLLRPLPYKDPGRLVQVWNTYPPIMPQTPNSAGDFRDFQQRVHTFSGLAAYIDTPRGLNLTDEGEPERVEFRYATSGLFPLLGINPIAGRNFTSEEDRPGSSPAVLMSHRLWESRFGSNSAIAGRTVTLDGRAYSVAGVLPEGLPLAPNTDIWMPIGQYDPGPDPYRYHEFTIIGRLKPGARIDQVQAELTALNHQQEQELPATHKNFGVLVTPLQEATAAKMRSSLLILLGTVGFVLLVACGNFVNLLMMRNAARQRDLALRVALGANRRQLLVHLVSESILLSICGGVLGALVAQGGLDVLEQFAPRDLSVVSDSVLNSWVLAFTAAISVLSGIGSGLIPALQMLSPNLHDWLKEGPRAIGGAGGRVVYRVLVVSEIALAIVPLIGAGLLIHSFYRLLNVDPGFRQDHVLAMELDKPQPPPAELGKLTNDQRLALFGKDSLQYGQLIERIRALPGVKAAGGVSVLPLGPELRSASRFVVEGRLIPQDGARPVAETRGVSPGYFAAMGIPLRIGRLLDERDSGSQNIVINEAFAEAFWPRGEALGKRINFCSLAPDPCWTTIVGVVGNVHQHGLDAAATFDSYGTVGWMPYTVIRTAGDPAALAQAVVAEIRKFDPDLPVTHIMSLDTLVAESVSPRRFSTFLLSLFAGLALLLAMIGVYAVMSYAVALRTKEIGLRIALGARPGDVCRMVLADGFRLVGGGIVLGLAGAIAVTKLLSRLLYGVTTTDPITFGGVVALLGAAALIACYVPARRAMTVDPIAALHRDT